MPLRPAEGAPEKLIPVFQELKKLLVPFAGGLKVTDEPRHYALTGPPTPASRGKEVWFGGAVVAKRYVSFHLMPVYAFPDLLRDVSPALKQRMQGKSCFNFTRIDPELISELKRLVKSGYARFKKEGLISS